MAETIKDIVDWMRDYPALLGWDLIAALDISELDPGLAEAHLHRWRNSKDLGAIEGNFQIGDMPVFHYLSGVRLGAVQVDVSFSNPQRPVIRWHMDVEGGTRTVVEAPKKIRSLSRFDLLDPARLQSRTPLQNASGRLLMDMSAGEEYTFDLGRSELEQLAGGRFFEKVLRETAKDDPERVRYVIAGTPESTENPFLATRSITASSWNSADGKRVVLLLLVALAHGAPGLVPSPESDFPFPLPEEVAKAGRGTLLMNLQSMERVALGHAVEHLLEGGVFSYQQQDSGKLAMMKATAGTLWVPPTDYESRAFKFESEAFELEGVGLEVDFRDAEPRLGWRRDSAVTFSYWPIASGDRQTVKAEFRLNLAHQFQLFHDSEHQHITRGRYFASLRKESEVELVSGLPEGIDADELAQIREFIAYAITRAVYRAIAPQLSGHSPEQMMAQFRLADVRHFASSQIQVEAPNNLAVFAPVSSQPAQFSIIQQNVLLKPRQEFQFTLDTEIPNVEWTVVPLPGSSGEWGTIDPATGEYSAPTANKMGPLETRVLVVATDPATSAESVSKVTVLTKGVTLNPLIHVTHANADENFQVALTAGALDGGELKWELVADEQGGGGIDGGSVGPTNIYTPPAKPLPGITFTVDEVRVTGKSGESTSSVLLVEHQSPLLEVLIDPAQQPEYGVQLQARFRGQPIKGVTWSKYTGSPGYLDEQTGVYEPDSYAPERFALLFAKLEIEPLGTLEGYTILPLPLEQHTGVRAFLTAVPANSNQQH
ncbi:hypothetical protein [Pseudomonas sp. TWI929]|uniref:hypothetical protein n=1 Tax=Pseudomonas sp. TWI929 TaxID=3136795 RepID=UPI0032094DB8